MSLRDEHEPFADADLPKAERRLGATQALRQRAEAALRRKAAQSLNALEALAPEGDRQALHELRVHHIELEMQNEELRRSQLELDAARARYFDLYDLAPIGYCTLSEQGLIIEANLTAASLLGVPRGALVRQAFSRFIVAAEEDIYYLHCKKLFDTGEPQACELQMVKGDGTRFWAHLAATAAEADGAQALRVVLSDIHQRKVAEAERARLNQVLQEQNAELAHARRVAEKANLAKSDFLASMSHELRTPLGAILGFAQLLESGSPSPTSSQARSIDQILRAGWHLLKLINEILDLALIESGKLSLSLEPVSLPDTLCECQAMIEPQAQARGVAVSFVGFAGPCLVHADRTRLKQILINLLANAIKYNRPGGTVAVDCRQSSPASSQERVKVRVSIRDSGAGLAPGQLAQLFEPFNRLGQEAGAEEGSGIGLVVCKRLIEGMGGLIGVDSTVGTGSTFWIELQVTAEETAADTGQVPLPAEAPAAVGESSRTVLCVEDNPANLMLVEEIVARRPGIHLLSARDGRRGLEMARASRPEVILMDINLPDLGGIEALKRLAEDPLTAHIPVIALSANARPDDVEKALQAGFFRYVTKPIQINAFMATLDLALKVAEPPSADASKIDQP